MTQKVTVLKVDGTRAKVIHNRPTACHGDCDHCAGGCGAMAAKERIVVEAENLIGAKPGDRVMIEGETSKVAFAIGIVYVLPVALFFLLYFVAEYLDWSSALFGIVGFILGIVVAILAGRYQRKTGKEIRFRIVSFAVD